MPQADTQAADQILTIDVVSDVVCPWCYIGKRRLEQALAMAGDVPVAVRFRPYFLNPWVPREGMSRADYLTRKFGSVEAYEGIAARVRDAAAQEGLHYNSSRISNQPNTLDCHRLILWADAIGQEAAMKQRLMDLYFRDGEDLTQVETLVDAAQSCGFDGAQVRARLASDEDVAFVSNQAQMAQDSGVSGVPTFIFARQYAVSGAQHPEMLAGAIRDLSAKLKGAAGAV